MVSYFDSEDNAAIIEVGNDLVVRLVFEEKGKGALLKDFTVLGEVIEVLNKCFF